MYKKCLLGILAVFTIAFFPGIIGIKTSDVKAATDRNVGGGQTYASISDAITAAENGDSIIVKSTYVSSTETFPIDFGAKTGIILDCQSSGATIQYSTTSTITLSEGSTIKNCNLTDVAILSAPNNSVTVLNNNVRLNTTTTGNAPFFSGSGSNLAVTSNTVNIYFSTNDSSDYEIIYLSNSLTASITSNTIKYNTTGDENLKGAIRAENTTSTTITGNYIKFPSSMSKCGNNLISSVGSTLININNNTLHFGGCSSGNGTTNGIGISDSSTGGTSNIATSTYNIFYISGTLSGTVNGIKATKAYTSSTMVIYEDYNGSNGVSAATSTAGDDMASISFTSGGHNKTSDPVFKTTDSDSDNDLQLIPYSQYLDVNSGNDIGAYSAVRPTTFYIDDTGTIDYSTVHSTTTTWLSTGLRTNDTVNLAAGTYDGVTIASSSVLTGGITLSGNDPANIYRATLHPFDYNNHGYNEIVPSGNGSVYFAYGLTGGDLHNITTQDEDISSHVGTTPQDWHLALVSKDGHYYTAYHRADIFANQASAQSYWADTIGGYTIDLWVTSTFDYTGSDYIYTAPVGPTVTTTYQSGTPAINITDATPNSIINVTGNSSGISLSGLDSGVVKNFVVQNASSTLNTYTITKSAFNYDSSDYDDADQIGSVAGAMLIGKTDACAYDVATADGFDISSLVASHPYNWNLALGTAGPGGPKLTLLVPNDVVSSATALNTVCSGVGWITVVWVTSTFSYSGGEFSYNSSAISSAGVTLSTPGYTNPPAITHTSSTFAGIKLVNSDSNTINNISLSNNTYGVWLTGDSASNNFGTSTLATSVSYDILDSSTGNNNLKNSTFSTASTSITGTGDINVYFKSRARITDNSTGLGVNGATVNFKDTAGSATTTVTTGPSGYSPYTTDLLAFVMDSTTTTNQTNGGYNPFTVSVEATSTLAASSTSANISSVNKLFSLAMVSAAVPGVTLSTSTLAVTEGSTTSTYTMVLDSQPTANVIITLSTTSSADISFSTSTLTFTSVNYATPQTIIVTATNDSIDETTETAYITHSASSTDSGYEGKSVSNVTVTVTDNDTATVTLSKTTSAVTEGGTTDTYTVVLGTQPTASVVITPAVTSAKATVSPTSLTFTTANWATPQTITITAVDDSSVESTHTDTITHTASSSDTNYNGFVVPGVDVTITDNDVASSGGVGTYYDIIPPTNTSIVISGGVTSTVSTTVTLTLGATGASQMMIANDFVFTSSTWETYSTAKAWVLTVGTGTKTVYAKFKDTAGNISAPVSDTIVLLGSSTTTPPITPITTTTIPTVTTPVTTPVSTVTAPIQTSAPVVVNKFKFTKTLKLGMSDNEVSELQKVLRDLKFFTYPSITKYFGNVTKNALLAYQKVNKLSVTGITDQATRDALNGKEINIVEAPVATSGLYKFTKFLYVGSTGTEVKQLQLKLTELGYYNGPISSYFGAVTKAAVIKLQKANNISPAPGWVGPGTREFLNGN